MAYQQVLYLILFILRSHGCWLSAFGALPFDVRDLGTFRITFDGARPVSQRSLRWRFGPSSCRVNVPVLNKNTLSAEHF